MTDPYTYENGTLKNKLGIKDYDKLRQAEANIGFIKLIDIDSIKEPPKGINMLQAIHKHIFEDIFDWAGEYRTVPIYKEEVVLPGLSIQYAYPKEIKKEVDKYIKELNNTDWLSMEFDDMCLKFAREMALLWKVHPFRDGNTRVTISYAYYLANKLGFPFDINTFISELDRVYIKGKIVQYSVRDKFVLACLDEKDYPEVEHLAQLFKNAILAYNQKENEQTRGLHG